VSWRTHLVDSTALRARIGDDAADAPRLLP
jgi:hypothetical protein